VSVHVGSAWVANRILMCRAASRDVLPDMVVDESLMPIGNSLMSKVGV
jgi:hypothetical protein